jgi:radical SAM-linked protein
MELKTRVDNEFLPFVTKPLRYLGNEFNVVLKDTQAVDLRIALCFPDIYEAGIRSVSFEVLYHYLNSHSKLWAERFYAPWIDAESLLRGNNIPLFSWESRTALGDFNLIIFYLPGKLTFTNMLTMLDLSGIPLKSTERHPGKPLVMGAGPALNNPEPLAFFLDTMILGDAEETLWEISETFMAERNEEWDKRAMLIKIAHLPGVYIPSFYEPLYNNFKEFQGIRKVDSSAPDRIHIRTAEPLEQQKNPLKPLVPLSDTTHTPRGNMHFERFIAEQGSFTPARLFEPVARRDIENLYEETQKLLHSAHNDPVNSLLENNDVFSELVWYAVKEKASPDEQDLRLSYPSAKLTLRLSDSSKVAEELRQNGFTLSLRSGSQRLRNVLNINTREQDLLDTLKAALRSGWQTFRLNFTIGLPGEKKEDISVIVSFIQKCLEVAREFSDVQFWVSVEGFSPRAHTPLQWEKQENPAMLEEKFSILRESLAGVPLKLTFQSPALCSLETILSRGDRKMGEVVEKAWRLGARFDASKDIFKEDSWRQAFQEAGGSWEDYLAPISITVTLPWDHIDIGVSKAYLKEEKSRASQAQIHPKNKDLVSIGYGGISRDQFARLLRQAFSADRETAAMTRSKTAGSTELPASAATETIQYGRKGRRRQTPVAVIKRKVRIRYSKTSLAKFLSHLDIVRVFERSAQLAKIPLVYSQGLRPTPKISYGPPLSPGISSTAEYLDMEVEIGRESDIQGRFNQFLPSGMQILQYQGIFAKVPALAAVINRTTYEVLIPENNIPDEMIQQWLAQPEVWIQRTSKDGLKDVEIRPYLKEVKASKNNLLVTIDINEGKTAKVTEVLESLLAPKGVDYRQFPIQRTGQYIVQNDSILTPFDIL